MDASTLESLIRSLEIRSQSLGSWLEFWIVCVVVGLLVECPVVVAEHFHKFGPPTWKNLSIKLIGPILIAAGVAGEFGVTLKTGKVETDLRNANRLLVGLVNEQTGKANERAGKANERAGAAEDRAAQANKKANAFRLQIAQANERAAQAEKDTQKERNSRLELQWLMMPRMIADRDGLAKALEQFKGQPVMLESYSGDHEGDGLCLSLKDVLLKAGFVVTEMCGRAIASGPASTEIVVTSPKSDRQTAESIATNISRIGRLGVISDVITPPGSRLLIFVGVKAQAYMELK